MCKMIFKRHISMKQNKKHFPVTDISVGILNNNNLQISILIFY